MKDFDNKELFSDFDLNFDMGIADSDLLYTENDPNDDPFDDDLPKQGSPLYNIMEDNHIYHTKQRKIYMTYSTENIGCNIKNPIVIKEIEDYVHWEYELLEYILRPSPYRFVDYEVLCQSLLSDNGKAIDRLTIEVSNHPLLTLEEIEKGIVPEKEVLGIEEYFFDITAGFNNNRLNYSMFEDEHS